MCSFISLLRCNVFCVYIEIMAQVDIVTFEKTEQNRTDYLFDVNYTVSSQSNTIIIYISRSKILSEYLNQVVVLI